jgi:hypothetical protein
MRAKHDAPTRPPASSWPAGVQIHSVDYVRCWPSPCRNIRWHVRHRLPSLEIAPAARGWMGRPGLPFLVLRSQSCSHHCRMPHIRSDKDQTAPDLGCLPFRGLLLPRQPASAIRQSFRAAPQYGPEHEPGERPTEACQRPSWPACASWCRSRSSTRRHRRLPTPARYAPDRWQRRWLLRSPACH